eukprot:TRINITY_DN4854_c0_g1_i2.p1 TRINITY_DN4854_c0_g1~~TRINITY_DN4854_c0_g1_i2.p1  ORF type:complete len:248 (+),score=45.33 TRINITY_DN4854_c0_g1_i2:28-744(+)
MSTSALFDETDSMIRVGNLPPSLSTPSFSSARTSSTAGLSAETSLSVESIVSRRLRNFDYVKRSIQGEVYWLNCIKVTKDEIKKFFSETSKPKRAEDWFVLGISLGWLLQAEAEIFLKALQQLWAEWEYISSGDFKWPDRLQKYKANDWLGTPLLQFPVIPTQLDFCEVVLSLCDILALIYKRFITLQATPERQDAVNKIDSKYKDILEKISGELTTLALRLVKKQLGSIQSMVEANP